jgi:cysteine desulfurase family protein (TIGR01976 family)
VGRGDRRRPLGAHGADHRGPDRRTLSGLDLDVVRGRFPALSDDVVFFDNGGGSQIAQPVLDRMTSFLVESNVQLGASYDRSRLASDRLAEAHRGVATLVNARDPDEVVMGPSTTALLRTLAGSLARTIEPGDEIVVTNGDHEANIGPWLELERVGARVRVWHVDPETGELDPDDLAALLGPHTRLVAVTHTSNILGSINPIREIADRVHDHGAWLCVDGVGFAPHRAVDVQALDADFYVFSFYKTFGPHHAVLWGRKELLQALPGHGFVFVSEDDVPYKFQPGNVNYELSYGVLGIMDYLAEIAGGRGVADVVHDRESVEAAFDLIADHEAGLTDRLLDFLRGRPGVRIVGRDTSDPAERVSIVSFVVGGVPSRSIVEAVDPHGIGIRFGHFYSARLIEALGLEEADGVVRVSMVHYNTAAEVDRLIGVLDTLLPSA